MKIEELLEELGLSLEETRIYLALLKLGSSLASRIAEETRINRSHVYQLLERLIIKGYVSYVIKENRRYYTSVNPEKLLDILREKEEKLKSALPELLGLLKPTINKPIVDIFEGQEAIKKTLMYIIRVKQDWFVFGSGRATEILPYYVPHWQKERQKFKIKMIAILNQSPLSLKRGKELKKLKLTEVRYMLEDYDNPSSIWVYGDRVVVVMWSKEHPFAIRTIDKEIAEVYKNYFNSLWKLAKK